jgi:hypothetical protein
MLRTLPVRHKHRLVVRGAAGVVILLAVASASVQTQGRATRPVFYDDDPIWEEPVTQDASLAAEYEPDLVYQTLEGLFGNPGDPLLGQRAKNVNTLDEVPDGPFYVNRAGRIALTPERVARAANTGDGPAVGPWTVVSAKSDGVTPGFTIRDQEGALWFIKFDPPGWRGMATGTEVVAAKLYWAVGYHTVEYHIGRLAPSNLRIGEGATITPSGQAKRPMVQIDIEHLLKRADREPDGTYRVILSRAAPGRPVGRIRFHGTRADDPNDLVPHEHRRELRGYRVFSAWLNHVDAKGINSLATLITEDGRSFIRRYLLDFGSALGSAAVGPREGWEGYEALFEAPGLIARRALTFGFLVPDWRTMRWYESPAIGRVPASHEHWDPQAWTPHIMGGAFRHMRMDDAFWAAQKLTFITDDMIDAVVHEGDFGNAEAERELARTIRERRNRILQTYLPAVNPVTSPALDGRGGLRFTNAAVAAGVASAPSGYRAAWFAFDNATGESTPIGETDAPASPLPAPTLPDSGFVKVEIRAMGGPAAWEDPVTAYFRRADGNWVPVGFERMP